jgi:SurA N-terminal domain
MAVLSRLIKVSALVLGAGLVVAGCSPVKLGAAAVVGDQRITVATLDTEVTNLSRYAKLYPGTVQLTPVQETQQTLTWLIRFQLNEQLAKQQGITISTAQAQAAWGAIFKQAKASAQAQGITNVTANLILTANGIPPNLYSEVGRYQAINDELALRANGGQAATTQQAQDAVASKLNQARCVVAKQLKIQVNPQYGRLDYTQYAVVASSPTVSRPAGPTPTASPSGLAPAC